MQEFNKSQIVLLCGAVLADSAVESGTVGYSTTSIEAGKFYMIATQFQGVNGTAGTIAINDLVKLTNVTPGTFSTRTTTAPHIQVWNGSGYKHYYYISDATLADSTKGNAWASARSATTDTIELGKAFWFTAISVESDADPSKSVSVGDSAFVMVGNPFPTALTFDMLTTTGITPGTFATRTTAAPHIQVWNGTGYKHYYYISDATLPDSTKGNAWAAARSAATGTLAEVGQGFWVQSATAGTLTMTLR